MHHLFKFFPVDKDKEFVFLWQWNSHSFLQDYESAWCVSWVPCASIFKSRKWWNVFIMSRKLVMWIFTVMRAADLVGDDVHYGLWGFDNVQPGKWLQVFWRNMLSPSAERMNILPEKKFNFSCPLAYLDVGCYLAFSYVTFLSTCTVTRHSAFRLEILLLLYIPTFRLV